MRAAVQDAGLQPNDVSYINAHATSTPLGDKAESQAIHRMFGNNSTHVKVSSVKGAFGEWSHCIIIYIHYTLYTLYTLYNIFIHDCVAK